MTTWQDEDEPEMETFEEDSDLEEPDPEVESGLVCALCGVEFVKEHGKPVACETCSGSEGAEDLPKATHAEKNDG